jgi:hypothetical protein
LHVTAALTRQAGEGIRRRTSSRTRWRSSMLLSASAMGYAYTPSPEPCLI